MLIPLFLFFFAVTDTIPQASDSTARPLPDSLRVDTLKEVTVHGGKLPVEEAMDRSLGAWNNRPRTKSFGDVLEKLSPGINDKITHPFAIKQRKKERRQKRARKILEHYDQVKTFNDLLREAIQREELLQQEKEGKEKD